MMPQLVAYRQRRPDGSWLRLYIPVLPVLLLLSPLLALAVVAGLVACVVYGINPVAAARGTGRVLWALSGAQFHLDDGHVAVQIDLL